MLSLDRSPPANVEAERAVIGAILLDPVRIDAVAELLRPEHFFEPTHQEIYKSILELHDSNRGVEVVALRDHLVGRNALDDSSAQQRLAELLDAVATSAHAEGHANIVREKAELRQMIHIASETIKDVHEATDSAQDVIDRAEKRIFEASAQRMGSEGIPVRAVLQRAFELIRMSREGDGINQGISTGYYDLDFILQGFRGGQLVIIAARPSVGKTTFALNLVRNMCVHGGKSGLLFSLEMKALDITLNLLCSMAKVDSFRLRSGVLTSDEENVLYDAGEILSGASFTIDDTSSLTTMSMRSRARRLKHKSGLDFIAIDYLQLLSEGATNKNDGRQQEVAAISRRLKGLANELDVPIISLSQLSRKVEDRTDQRPRLADLRESGAIEQDADIVLLLHREDYVRRQQGKKDEEIPPEARNKAEIIVAKNRNGPTGVAELAYFREAFRFENLARE